MTKDKRGKRKRVRAPADPVATPEAPAASSPRDRRPEGQRLWDMPYSASPPRLINPGLGLHNLVARAGHNAGYDIDVTLLDAPDHRLIRSGVLLAHRVFDGRGEWYLGAPDWVPLLPKERIDPMSQAELPEDLADLIRPFRRRAPLGPVAALRCERREFALRDDRGNTLALLRDDKVTVRRGGLTTARYREVMLTPVGAGLDPEQRAWLDDALDAAGATRMQRFPRLVTRLGAPSNGLTDFPVPQPFDPGAPFSSFVSSLLASRLRQLLEADLAIRTDRPGGSRALVQPAQRLCREIEALSPVLDPGWIEDLAAELEWLVAQVGAHADVPGHAETASAELKARLRGERYLTLLERLVTAARAPKAGDSSALPALDVVEALGETSLRRLVKRASRLTVDSTPENWTTVASTIEELVRVQALADLLPAQDRTGSLALVTQLATPAAEAVAVRQRAAQIRESVSGATPAEAFELGRRYERALREDRSARDSFLRRWNRTQKRLGSGPEH